MTARCVMVLGTSSGAGKSWIATALCRHYARQGLKVAPFKAQNMSNNARVVGAAGSCSGAGERPGEIGSAQYFQALAAGALPDVRMNPVLLKPEADTRSQLLLLGQLNSALSALPWRGRGKHLWPHIAAALDALRAENDVVVIEGAGSPAEINLMADDLANLRVARHADARCLLVADIDRGGALAHLYGTWALLPEADRARIRGFVLNKFRGDAALLAPAPEQLHTLTGVPTVAVVPMRFGHGLPEEDGVFDDRDAGRPAQPPARRGEGTAFAAPASAAPAHQAAPGGGASSPTRIAIVAYPRISNLDEFQPLKNLPGVHLSWVRSPAALAGADWIILPGSKATAADLAWLRAQGLDTAVAAHAARGARVLGICGGLQMLGEALIDLHGIEPVGAARPPQAEGAAPAGGSATRAALQRGDFGNGPGLGLLPLVTRFDPDKTVRRVRRRFGALSGAWSALSGLAVTGYEIHSGRTVQHPAMATRGDVAREVMAQLAWQNAAGNVLGVYLHGLFEDAGVLRALFGAGAPALDTVFDGLADTIERAFAPGVLDALLQ